MTGESCRCAARQSSKPLEVAISEKKFKLYPLCILVEECIHNVNNAKNAQK